MQRDLETVLTDILQRTLRHANRRFLNVESLFLERLGDIRVGDRAEQFAVDTSLLRDLNRESLELLRFLLRSRELLVLRFFQLGAPLLELRQILAGGTLRLALRDQIIARKAIPHLDDVSERAKVRDLFQKNDLHGPPRSMHVGVRQQREITRALDRNGELPLVARLGARDARRNDLAVLVDEILQHTQVFVVDLLHAFCRKPEELAPANQRAAAFVAS